MIRRPGPLLLLLLLLIACGQEGAGIGQRASAALDPQVRQVRAAATSGDRAGAARELAELRQAVADLRQRGELTDEGAARVLNAAAEVEARLAEGTAATQVAPTTPVQSDTRGTTRTAREAEDEARKRAEEAAKKAEEEAKKRADEAKKRADEAKKRAEEGKDD